VWSITVPVALIESAFPSQRDRPWLGTWGRVGYALAFLVGAALIAVFSYQQVPFMASPLQFGTVGALILGLCVAAVKLPKPGTALSARMPPVIALFLASFLAGSAFMLAGRRAETAWHLGWVEVVALSLGIVALFVLSVIAWTRGGRWDEPRRFALTAGGFLVYAWIGFETDISLHGRADLAGHSLIAGLLCLVLVTIGVRVARSSRSGC
jgi:FtsH-binding integral membrane protein